AVDEAELHRGLLDALGEIALVEREAKLPVLEDVVGARLVVAASRALHQAADSKAVAIVGAIPSLDFGCKWVCRGGEFRPLEGFLITWKAALEACSSSRTTS